MKPLRVLIVEDSEDDTLLLIRALRKGGYDVAYERVETGDSMKDALERPWDLVISDYVLPSFSGLAALNVLKESEIDLPFILVSGNIGEDMAVGAMKAGAHDYIMKGSLKRLVPAVERELSEAVVRRERKRAEDALKNERQRLYEVLEVLPVYVTLLRPDHSVAFANRFYRERFGEPAGRCCSQSPSESDPSGVSNKDMVVKTGEPLRWELDGPDGRYYDIFGLPFTDTDGSTLVLEMGIDITKRKEAEKQLTTYLEKLEKSNRDLEDFVHVASHDLQEPVRKLQTFADLVALNRKCGGDRTRDYLERMKTAAQRMQDLILELLRYSGVNSAPTPFTLFNLYEVVNEAVSDLAVLCAEEGGRIEVANLPDIEADRVQMRQLFQNLIGNGLKYHGEQKPVVRIYGHSADSDPFREIHVKDNGIGFDESYLDKIFKPFQRLHSRDSSYSGTGMGLAICRRIVERHEGTITAKSRPGEGATFIVRLPVRQSERNRMDRDRLAHGKKDPAMDPLK